MTACGSGHTLSCSELEKKWSHIHPPFYIHLIDPVLTDRNILQAINVNYKGYFDFLIAT